MIWSLAFLMWMVLLACWSLGGVAALAAPPKLGPSYRLYQAIPRAYARWLERRSA